jgi:hypothetical protein
MTDYTKLKALADAVSDTAAGFDDDAWRRASVDWCATDVRAAVLALLAEIETLRVERDARPAITREMARDYRDYVAGDWSDHDHLTRLSANEDAVHLALLTHAELLGGDV